MGCFCDRYVNPLKKGNQKLFLYNTFILKSRLKDTFCLLGNHVQQRLTGLTGLFCSSGSTETAGSLENALADRFTRASQFKPGVLERAIKMLSRKYQLKYKIKCPLKCQFYINKRQEECRVRHRRYVKAPLKYMMDFLGRVHSLLDLNVELEEANKEFEIQWEANSCRGWPREAGSALTLMWMLIWNCLPSPPGKNKHCFNWID